MSSDRNGEPTLPPRSVKTGRSFVRAFVAARYVLGHRRQRLSAAVQLADPELRSVLAEITTELSHPAREQRARVLATEVGRMIRSLVAQRLR